MSYWVRDAQGRVFGPTTIEIVRELIATGRLRDVTEGSRDGRTWEALADVAAAARQTVRGPADGEAVRLRARVASLEGRPPHEVFGARAEAGPEELRRAYLAIVKDYHPARLSPNASPELRAAAVEMFQFLGRVMARVGPAVPAMPGPVAAPGAATRPPVAPAPTYALDEFVGFERRGEDRLEVRIPVSIRNLGMFVDHALVNLSRGGMFVATTQAPELGSVLDVVLTFEAPPREVRARAKVSWATAVGGRSQAGMGLSFVVIAKDDLRFIEEFVRAGLEKLSSKK